MIDAQRQGGTALIALVGLVMLALAATAVAALNLQRARLEREARTTSALAQVRGALTAWSVGHPNHPGMLPYPDRNHDGNYDGNSDCVTAAPTNPQLLGRVPWLGQTNPCVLPHSGLSARPVDAAGEISWMAVSRNLVYEPGIYPPLSLALRDSIPPAPWMTVVDTTGALVSSRVAVVLLAPGAALGAQVRGAAAPQPPEFLDSLAVGPFVYSNADNSDLTFVAAEADSNFNDRMSFMTIEQWVDAVMPRVEGEVRASLGAYLAANGYFPPYAAAAADGACTSGTASGFLPLRDGDCGTSLEGHLPAGQLGAWLAGWGPDIGYRRDAALQAHFVIDGADHVVAP